MSKDLIYHYTNATGLKGIITNQELWATNVWFMNDRGEATFGLETLLKFLNSSTPESDFESAVLQEAVRVAKRFDATDDFYQSYIACLSKKGDLLSQWRAYGKDGGFSLGFDRNTLSEIGSVIAHDNIRAFRILDVTYTKSAHKKTLQDLYVKHVQKATETNSAKVASNFAIAAVLFASGIKHPAFKEEAEVRLHAIRFGGTNPPDDVDFRESAMGITPYVKLPLITEDHIKHAIREVIVGPQRHSSEAVRAITQLLQLKGLSSVDVRLSKVPLRA